MAQQRSEDSTSLTNTEATVPAASVPSVTKRSSLKDLEEQLRRSLRPFSPKGSLDGVLAPEYGTPAPVVVAPARKRSASKENNGWIFPDDLTGDLNVDDPFAMPEDGLNGKSKKKASMDPYYRSLNRNARNTDETPSLMGIDPTGSLKKANLGSSGMSSSDEGGLPGGIKDSAQSLQKMMQRSSQDSDFSMPTGVKSSFLDFFGMGDRSLTPDQVLAHKNYMQQFQQLLDGNSASPGGPPKSVTFSTDAATTPAASMGGMPAGFGSLPAASSSASWSAFDSKPGSINPTLTPNALPNVNAQVLNQWNTFSTPPQPETPRVSPSTPTSLVFPHRKF